MVKCSISTSDIAGAAESLVHFEHSESEHLGLGARYRILPVGCKAVDWLLASAVVLKQSSTSIYKGAESRFSIPDLDLPGS